MTRDGAVRVLLVDDEQDFAIYLGKRLRARRLVVDVAFDGESALERLTAAPYDVVVLDLLMPGLDGLSTLREIRRLYPDVAVVMLSGHTSQQMADEGLRLGAAEYLLKPCEFRELCAAIATASAPD